MKTGNQVSYRDVSTKALFDALGVCGGLYRMNATYATAYVFNCNGKEVTRGMFASDDEDVSGYAYSIDLTALPALNRKTARRALSRIN